MYKYGGGGHAWFMLVAGESGVSQQHSGTESSAAASADNDKPGEASHRERDRESETGWTESEET